MSTRGYVALTVSVDAPPETIWSLIRHVQDVASWNSFLARSSLLSGATDGIGATREVVTRDGLVVHEQLIELDDARRLLKYKLVTRPILVVEQHNWIVVVPGEDERLSLVTFSADFQLADGGVVKDVADANGAAFIAAANGLGSHLGVDVYVVAIDL